MPQVPYQPFPTQQSREAPTPFYRLSVPADAFGENIGRAISGLGATVSKVGDELWGRAVAMQELRNETEVTNALSDMETRSADLRANYFNTMGQNAVNGYQGFVDSQNKLRDDIRAGLSNPMAQKMFDRTALGVTNRAQIAAASHSAQELRRANQQSDVTAMDVAAQNAGYAANDDEFNLYLNQISAAAQRRGADQGWDDATIQDRAFQAQSKAYVNRIDQIGKTNPALAQAMMEKALQERKIHTNDMDRIEGKVNTELVQTGSRVIARRTLEEPNDLEGWYSKRFPNADTKGLNPDFATRLYTAAGVYESETGNVLGVLSSDKDIRKGQEALSIDKGPFLDWLHKNGSRWGLEFPGDKKFDVAPGAISGRNGEPVSAFIVHHTSGSGDVEGVRSTLRERGLGVQYVMDREGNITQIGGPGAAHMMSGWGAGTGLSNSNTVGMEVIARNDKDVTPAQIEAARKFIAERYPNTPVFGHGEVNPGHKEADEGMSIVNAIRNERSGAPPVNVDEQTFIQLSRGAGHQEPTRYQIPEKFFVDRARRQAEQIAPNNAQFIDAAISRTMTDYRQQRSEIYNQNLLNKQTIESEILTRHPSSLENLLSISPDARQAYDGLDPRSKMQIERMLRTQSNIPTPEQQRNYNLLNAMSRDVTSIPDFANYDLDADPDALIGKHREELRKRQIAINNKTYAADPRYTTAMRAVRPYVPLALQNNKQEYHIFQGALMESIENWQRQPENKGKYPTNDELVQMAREMLLAPKTSAPSERKDQGMKGMMPPNLQWQFPPEWWKGSDAEKSVFDRSLSIPTVDEERIREEFAKRGLFTPNDEDIRRGWIAEQLDQLRVKPK